MATSLEARSAPGRSTRRNIALFVSGYLSSSLGWWAQKAVLGWLAWDLTRSVAWVGVVASADLITALWVAPLAGTIADRTNPFSTLLSTHTALLTLACGLFLAYTFGLMSIGVLFAGVLIESTVTGFNQPSRIVILNLIASPQRLSQLIATSSISVAVARCLGPALAGLLIHFGWIGAVFLANALTIVGMMVVLQLLRRAVVEEPPALRHGFMKDVVGGFLYVVESPHIRTLMLLAGAFALLGRPFSELFPAISGTLYEGGAEVIAQLMTAQGLGALLGGMVMLRRMAPAALLKGAFAAGTGLVISVLIFINAASLSLAVGMVVVAGFFHVICNIALQSLCQQAASADMRGRIASLYGIIFRAAPALGAFVIAQIAHVLGIGLDVLISIGVLAYGLVLLLLLPGFRRKRN
ncbi:MAG: MFS transporter [Burkholderiaceae bacterium]